MFPWLLITDLTDTFADPVDSVTDPNTLIANPVGLIDGLCPDGCCGGVDCIDALPDPITG